MQNKVSPRQGLLILLATAVLLGSMWDSSKEARRTHRVQRTTEQIDNDRALATAQQRLRIRERGQTPLLRAAEQETDPLREHALRTLDRLGR